MEPAVRYQGELIVCSRGERLLDVILRCNPEHRHICGGHGFCTSCRVEVLSGSDRLSPVSALEQTRLGASAGQLRLACQTRVYGTVEVRVPPPQHGRFLPE